MSETVWVPVRIQGGKLRIEQRRYFEEAIRAFPDCQGTLTFKRSRPSKSQEALGYLYGRVFPMIAEDTGEDRHVVKWEMKNRFLTVTEEALNKHTGEVRFVDRVKSIGELNSKELATFIDQVILEAAESFGIVVPPPDRNWKSKREDAA
jgi:hypothetical protein